MNSLQLELDQINEKLELLTYRKQQLDSIMSEYSDVVNRVKSLVDSMQDANIEPSNLLMEIEGIIFNVQPELEPTPEEMPTESEPTPELEPTEEEPTAEETEPTPEQTPEPVKLMALVPTVSTPTPSPEIIDDGVEQEEYLSYIKNHQPTPKTRLNERAWRRGDTLLIGFSNKRLMNSWLKWIKDNWSDRVNVTIDTDDEPSKGFPFPHCLSVLWYSSSQFIDWEKLAKLDYSLKPDEQPTGINLDDVRDVIQKLKDNGLKFISKGELLAHHLNSLKASDLEDHLDKLAEEGLIILGNKSIDLCVKSSEQKPDNPTFEYTEVDSKTTKVHSNGMLLGIAKNCGTHWESPQFPGQTFSNRRDVVAGLWQLVNKF